MANLPSAGLAPARTALVTGASRGIGRSIALGLAAAGLDVALVARDRAKLELVAAEIEALGRNAVVLPCEITDADSVQAAVAAAEAGLGGIDLLVNNAGRVEQEGTLWESDVDDWWATFEVNVRGTYLLDRFVIPGMLVRGGGRVVDLSSGAGSHGSDTISAYTASKTALLRNTEHLHLAGFARGLRAFGVAPGVVATDMTASMPMHDNRVEWTPVSRVVDMIVAIAGGQLDACSGWFIRVTDDDVATLQSLASAVGTPLTARKLRPLPAGESDPLTEALTNR